MLVAGLVFRVARESLSLFRMRTYAGHAKLYLFNAFEQTATVEIKGFGHQSWTPDEAVQVPEGVHHSITGPGGFREEFDVTSGVLPEAIGVDPFMGGQHWWARGFDVSTGDLQPASCTTQVRFLFRRTVVHLGNGTHLPPLPPNSVDAGE